MLHPPYIRLSLWPLIVVLSFFLFVAYNSSGYHHWDEHYQIVEFANYKLGNANLRELAWEFNAHIRSGVQPLICYYIFKISALLGVSDPYHLAFFLRAVSGIFAVFVIGFFIHSAKGFIKEENYILFCIMSYFLWYIPYLSVRFSSETWSGLFFILSISLVLSKTYHHGVSKLILLGVFIGLSILFRYQSALLAFGLLFWFLLVDKVSFLKITLISGTILFILILGVLIDYWLYGVFTFTLYNYFYTNIVEDVASNFGVSPWYHILLYILFGPGPILGTAILSSLVIITIYKPKSMLLWSIMPFLIIHSIIPHKELRFLYPIAFISPLVLVLAWQEISDFSFLKLKALRYSTLICLFAINTAGLIAVSQKGAGLARVSLIQFIHRNYTSRKVNLMYVRGTNPYARNTFYKSSEVTSIQLIHGWEKKAFKRTNDDGVVLIVVPTNRMTKQRIRFLYDNDFERVYETVPWLVRGISKYYDSTIDHIGLTLYKRKN